MSDDGITISVDGRTLLTFVWAFVSLLVAAFLRFGDTTAVLEGSTYLDLVFWGWWLAAFLSPPFVIVGGVLLLFGFVFLLAWLFGDSENVEFNVRSIRGGDDDEGSRSAGDDEFVDVEGDVVEGDAVGSGDDADAIGNGGDAVDGDR